MKSGLTASDLPFVKGLDEKLPLLDDLEKLDLRDFGAELKEECVLSPFSSSVVSIDSHSYL